MAKGPATKTEYVYGNLRREILSGALKPDQRLRLGELASRYETSEMPVREALRMLHRDGLIIMHNHRGAMVSKLSAERAAEYVEVRMLLETYAASSSTRFHTEESIAKLRQIQARMEKAVEAGQSGRFRQMNRELHEAICAPCPNTVLKSTLAELWDQVWRAHSDSIFDADKGRMAGALAEHAAIVKAIASRDPARVEAAMDSHRQHTLKAWRRVVEQKRAQERA
ncbi:MAG: GntR family transcriptional regulator [Hyphomicrobiaceae bacterium]|nr:GntR family transcriptional regulator [Hyphomicrobiaceae bacterium]